MRLVCVLTVLTFVFLARPSPAQETKTAAKKALDEVLTGKITSLKKDVIVIRYDFDDDEELDDWVIYKPFRVAGELKASLNAKSLKLKGVGALHHKIIFRGLVEIEFDITPWITRDLGAVISEEVESDQFVLYSINDLNFQKWDGAKTPGHMITRFGVKDASEPRGSHAFRYVARGTQPEITAHKTLRMRARKEGDKDEMDIGDRTFKGKESGRPISELYVGLYVCHSSCVVDSIRITGRISPRWLERVGAELRLSKPLADAPPEETGPSPEDIEASARIRRYQAGAASADDLLTILENPAVAQQVKETAALALAESGDKSLVKRAIPLLYAEDIESRSNGLIIVKGLTRKSFGYNPKASQDKRRKAIQNLIKHIQKRPHEFGAPR